MNKLPLLSRIKRRVLKKNSTKSQNKMSMQAAYRYPDAVYRIIG